MQFKNLAALLLGLAFTGVVADPSPEAGALEVRAEQAEQATQGEQTNQVSQAENAVQEHQGKQGKSWYPWPRPRPQPNNWCPPWLSWCRRPGPGPNPGFCPYGSGVVTQCVNYNCQPHYDNFWDRVGTCTAGYLAGCQCDKCGGSNGGSVGSCSASNGCNGGGSGWCQGGEYAGCPCRPDPWVWKA